VDVTIEVAEGAVTAVEEKPGKIRVTFAPYLARADAFEITAYQTKTNTVVWLNHDGRQTSKVMPLQVLTPERMARELAESLRQARTAGATAGLKPTFGIWSYVRVWRGCHTFYWTYILCMAAAQEQILSNSDCDMSSPAYNACVSDYPDGAGRACRCANCQNCAIRSPSESRTCAGRRPIVRRRSTAAWRTAAFRGARDGHATRRPNAPARRRAARSTSLHDSRRRPYAGERSARRRGRAQIVRLQRIVRHRFADGACEPPGIVTVSRRKRRIVGGSFELLDSGRAAPP